MVKTATKRKETYHHGDLRAQLVKTISSLVERDGPENFSISEACRAAGVSTAAPYRHFTGKSDMLVAVAFDGMARLRDQTVEALEQGERGTFESLSRIGQTYVAFAIAEPGVFRLIFSLTEEHDKDLPLMELGDAILGLVKEEISLVIGRSEPDEEISRLAFTLWTMVHGAAFLAIDKKVDKMKYTMDLDDIIATSTEKLISPHATG